jgi:hypothetical protein
MLDDAAIWPEMAGKRRLPASLSFREGGRCRIPADDPKQTPKRQRRKRFLPDSTNLLIALGPSPKKGKGENGFAGV